MCHPLHLTLYFPAYHSFSFPVNFHICSIDTRWKQAGSCNLANFWHEGRYLLHFQQTLLHLAMFGLCELCIRMPWCWQSTAVNITRITQEHMLQMEESTEERRKFVSNTLMWTKWDLNAAQGKAANDNTCSSDRLDTIEKRNAAAMTSDSNHGSGIALGMYFWIVLF